MRDIKLLFPAAMLAVSFFFCFRHVAYSAQLTCTSAASVGDFAHDQSLSCGGSASASALAGTGLPGGHAFATASAGFGTLQVSVAESGYGLNSFDRLAPAISFAASGFNDVLHVTSPGSEAVFRTTFTTHASASTSFGGRWNEEIDLFVPGTVIPGSSPLPAGWFILPPGGPNAGALVFHADGLDHSHDTPPRTPNDPSTTISVVSRDLVGSTTGIGADLIVSAASDITAIQPGSAASLDSSHTSHFFVEVLTPGVSYTSDSGQIYDLAHEEPTSVPRVPAPSTGLLLGSGIIALAALKMTGREKTRSSRAASQPKLVRDFQRAPMR
jgi:hypothetical protein